MGAPARHSTSRIVYGAFDREEPYALDDVFPDERISSRPSGTGRKCLLWGAFILFALGGGWALLGGRSTWPDWLPVDVAAIFHSINDRVPGPPKPTASAAATTPPVADAGLTPKPGAVDGSYSTDRRMASSNVVTPPAVTASSLAPLTTAALPPAAKSSSVSAPLPGSPTADPADPYQKRAVAVGLHPDLSRVLLARLSPTDYRNAGIAIQTAVAETPDSAIFVWPRQRKPELALFQIRFVAGAAPSCRRYVVVVTKDGWSTTALPVEKCNVRLRKARRE